MSRTGHATCLLVFMVLAACQRTQKDPRIAENESPHIVVRVIDRVAESNCDRGTLSDTLKCKLEPSTHIGCVYAETGVAIDTPILRSRREPFDCNTVETESERMQVANQPLRHVKFFPDERRERVVLQAGESTWLFLFFNGALLDSRALDAPPPGGPPNFTAEGTPDWSRVPALIDVVPAHAERFSNEDLDALTRESPDGGAKLERSIVKAFGARDLTPDDTEWPRLYERLSEPRRKEIADELLRSIEGGDAEAVTWARNVPVPREALIDALVKANSLDDSQELPEAFNLLGRLDPQRLAPLACHRLEKAWFDNIEGDLSMSTVALAVIAREKLRCPWVEPWLNRHACAWQVREESETVALPSAPLASVKTRQRAIDEELTVYDEADAGEEEEDDDEEPAVAEEYTSEPWGPLLLAAGYAQGQLPHEFSLRNARRFYRRVYLQPENEDDLCRASENEMSEWVCELPIAMHELRRGGCVIEVDDEKRVLTLGLERR